MSDKCPHNIESESPLTVCLYCFPCELEIHSMETLDLHQEHHKISLEEFNNGKTEIKPKHPTEIARPANMTVQEVLNKNKRAKEFIEAMTYEEIMAYINFLALSVQQLKEDQLVAYKHKAKLELTMDGDVVEKMRANVKVRTSTKARISKEEKSFQSMADMFGISLEEAKRLVKEGKSAQ